MRSIIVVGAALALALGGSISHAQVVNWDAVAPQTSAPASTTVNPTSPIPSSPTTRVQPAPPPPTATVPVAPAVDIGAMAGYRRYEGQPPTRRLDDRVSPALMRLYEQRPGESERQYIDRMAKLYRETQSRMEADRDRNAAFIRSLAPRPREGVSGTQGR